MSKGQHGNREAKKPKQPQAAKSPLPVAALPSVPPALPVRLKKK